MEDIAHDLNNLLTTILGNAEMVESAQELDESVYECVAEIRRAAESATDLIAKLRSTGGSIGSTMVHAPAEVPSLPRGDTGKMLPPVEGEKKIILVVEDDDSVRRMICKLLKRHGYRVLESIDVKDALRIASRTNTSNIHLLLTDVIMPVMNGMDLAERITSEHPETKVLFISGHTDETVTHLESLREGENFLKKPFLPMELTRMIRRVLSETDVAL
jgi:CheY-like chemotaxis protein